MSELEGMINGLLSNPDEMKKIMDMAGKLMGQAGGQTGGEAAAAVSPDFVMPSEAEISKLLSGLTGGQAPGAASSAGGSLGAAVPGDLAGLLGGGGLGNLSGLLGEGGLGNLSGLLGEGGLGNLSGLLGGGGLGNLSSLLGGGGEGVGSLLGMAQSVLASPTVKKFLGSGTFKNILSEASKPRTDKRALLTALKPWISAERQTKLERAITFAGVMRFAGAAALGKGGSK
jgi:hypothetical protein